MKDLLTARFATRSAKVALFGKILAGLVGVFALAVSARAAVTINIQQVGSDVVATSSGSLNLSGLGLVTANGSTGANFMSVANGYISLGTPGSSTVYSGFSTSGSLGSGGFTSASSSSGDITAPDKADGYLFLPHNYVTGASLASTATWLSTNFTTLGLTDGASLTYTWSGDAITVNVVSAIPEPATVAFLSGSSALLLVAIYRRRPGKQGLVIVEKP
ncbi:MAG: hypothetical protein JF599_03320 [Verrucomicrobia bacterium]|nr:hypothetical protein [Verrucomicrobiota bacterium]